MKNRRTMIVALVGVMGALGFLSVTPLTLANKGPQPRGCLAGRADQSQHLQGSRSFTFRPLERAQASSSRIVVPTGPREVPVPPPAIGEGPKRYVTSPAALVVRGRFTSVQVNVDPQGRNILWDAANEPSIAVDPTHPGRMAIGWRQFDTVTSDFRQAGHAYSRDGGSTWTFPGVLDPGQFRSDPVLGSDADGNFYFYSLSSSTSAEIFKSIDGGVTWTEPVWGFGGDKEWLAVDRTTGIGRGNIYGIWNVQFSCCWPYDFTRSTSGASSFETLLAIPPPSMKWGTMDIGPAGDLYAVGTTLYQDGFLVAKSTNAQNPGATPVFDFIRAVDLGGDMSYGGGPNPAGLLGQVWVATDHSDGPTRGNVYMLASVVPLTDDPLEVMFIRSADGGLSWSAPVRINDDPPGTNAFQWFGTMSVAPSGRIDVVWNDTRNDGTPWNPTFSELYYSFSLDAGRTWSTSEPVSPPFNHFAGYPQQEKLGDYYHMISENGGAKLAYAATFNDEQDVYFVWITPDCNGNGVADEADISSHASVDCNGNLIPDECEPIQDCNGNGTQDICDIAAGTSRDCEHNRIPDECEPFSNCNGNGVRDACDIAAGTSRDCNFNDVPDECELSGNDCNDDSVPDECELRGNDCNRNGIPDECDVADGSSADCQDDDIPDECQLEDLAPPLEDARCSETAIDGQSWCDDFESYELGSIQGMNHWQGWGFGSGDPGLAGIVTTDRNFTPGGLNSLRIEEHDTVHLFSEYDIGTSPFWVLRVRLYAPSTAAGTGFCILLPDYDGGGWGTTWASEVFIVPQEGTIASAEAKAALPLVTDQWTELRYEIDFAKDTVTIFYENAFLGVHPWSIGGGSPSIAAIDLYSPTGSGGIYYDDLSLAPAYSTDCNGNQVPDECDIADGHSPDVNRDNIPDECELLCDFDGDGDVDLDDYRAFAPCLTGPAGSIFPHCRWADVNLDDRVDLADFAAFQSSFIRP